MTLDFPTLGYPTRPTSIFYFPKRLVYDVNRVINSSAVKMLGLLKKCSMICSSAFMTDSSFVCSDSYSLITESYCFAEKKMWFIPFSVKYLFQRKRTSSGTRSLLFINRRDSFLCSTLMLFTYLTKSSHLKNSGSLPSTIWTIKSERSVTLQSCLHTSIFFS